MSVVLDKDELNIHEDLSEDFLTIIQKVSPDRATSSVQFDQNVFEKAKNKAIQYMADQRNVKHEELKSTNDALINSRIGALEQTFFVKHDKVKEFLETATDDRIIRMRKAQLRNIETNYRKRIEAVEQGRNLTVTYQYAFAGVMRIDPISEML